MAELGNTLSRARRARGISLEDVERDTHVSKRYLQALEAEDFSVFPAPVYARGFLRTYARYLGLNPEELVRVFPNGDLTVDMTPLPTVSRPPAQMINVNWVVAGVVMIFLLGIGLLLLRGGGDAATISQAPRGASTVVIGGAASPSAQTGAPAAASSSAAPVQGKPIGPIRPGQYPDFVGADLPSALAVLRDNQMSYAIIEAPSKSVAKGIVISQTPGAGGKATSDTAVTLVVSAGAGQ
jgi:hypothetical protein